MTRGRQANTVHLVATDLDDAREQWVAAFARDWADLGPAHAATRAAREAAGYTPARPLDQVLTALRDAWDDQAHQQRDLHRATTLRERLAEVIALRQQRDEAVAIVNARAEQARATAEQARAAVDHCVAVITEHAQQLRDRLLDGWNEQYDQAQDAARVVLAGPGRFGHRFLAVNRATETLARWSLTWQLYLPDMSTSTTAIAHYAIWHDRYHIAEALDAHARTLAERNRPEHHDLQHTAGHAEQQWRQAQREAAAVRRHYEARLSSCARLGHAADVDQLARQIDQRIVDGRTRLDDVDHRLNRLAHEPAVTSQPADWLETQHESWQAARHAERATLRRIT